MEQPTKRSFVRVLVHLMNGVVEVHSFSTLLGAAVFLGGIADRQAETVRVTVCDGGTPLYETVRTSGGWVEKAQPVVECG